MLLNAQSGRDRTGEFLAIVERLRKSQVASTSAPAAGASINGASSSHFSQRAQAMSLRISELAGRIQQLTRLAKQSSMFEDSSTQINSLTVQVKLGLQGLNEELQDLQALAGHAVGRGQSGSHAARVVDNLRGQLSGTTSSFKAVLEVRRSTLQAAEARRGLFADSTANSGAYQRTSFFEDEPNPAPEEAPLISQSQEMVPQADAYLQSRDEALQQINSTIQELGGIFAQVAQMVQEQGELAVRIDENVDNVAANVEGAQAQLLRYLQTISSNRWLALKVFGVLIVFIMLFIFVS